MPPTFAARAGQLLCTLLEPGGGLSTLCMLSFAPKCIAEILLCLNTSELSLAVLDLPMRLAATPAILPLVPSSLLCLLPPVLPLHRPPLLRLLRALRLLFCVVCARALQRRQLRPIHAIVVVAEHEPTPEGTEARGTSRAVHVQGGDGAGYVHR
jgi:hypothetical protein